MNRLGAIKKPVRDDLCVVCHYDYSSHEWFLPAGKTASDGCVGHDFTPVIGKPIPFGHPDVHEAEGEK